MIVLISPRSVIESRKTFPETRENSSFKFLYGPMSSGKILMQTTKWSTNLKIPDFQIGGKSKLQLQLIHHWKRNLSGLILPLELGSKNGHILSY